MFPRQNGRKQHYNSRKTGRINYITINNKFSENPKIQNYLYTSFSENEQIWD